MCAQNNIVYVLEGGD